jgi:4'-phosphopantetheinyl transferase
MSTSERRGLDAIGDDEEKARAFMKLWTLKEAYVKALGLGIAGRPFREFDVSWTRVARGDGDNGAVGCAIDGVKASTEGGIWRIDLSDDAAPEASRAWSMALLKPRLEHEHVLALCIPSADESTRADIRVRWATPFDDVVNEDAVPALLGASSRFFA